MLPQKFCKTLEKLLSDKRINVTHISFYVALLLIQMKHSLTNEFPVSRKIIMDLAHINSISTYHKYLSQLQEYGYVTYKPSFSYYKRSCVSLMEI